MLYEDDIFHPNYEDGLTENKKTVPSNFGLQEFSKKNECIITSYVDNKLMKIKCYKSSGINTRIINAISGEPYRGHLIGSRNEDFYFKVCVPHLGSFFYISPEECEKHMRITFNENIKSSWRQKFIHAQIRKA